MAGWEALAQGARDPFFASECDGYPALVLDVRPCGCRRDEPEVCDTCQGVDGTETDAPAECCGDPGDCGTCGPTLVDYNVVVQGRVYTIKGSSRVSVRLLRAGSLKHHGILNYRQADELSRTWEVRDAAGRELKPDEFVDAATVGRVYVNPRPGWGG